MGGDDNEDTVAYLTSVVQELTFLTKLFERVFRLRKKWDECNGLAFRIYEMEKALNNVQKIMDAQNEYRNESVVSVGESFIKLENVTIETPNNEVLIRDLSIRFEKACIHLLLDRMVLARHRYFASLLDYGNRSKEVLNLLCARDSRNDCCLYRGDRILF